MTPVFSVHIYIQVYISDTTPFLESFVIASFPNFIKLFTAAYTSDTNGLLADLDWFWFGMASRGCSHIATNLGSHRAQTRWV